jgi:signal transduction histidine kinase/signal recognition particle receptor subunit beta
MVQFRNKEKEIIFKIVYYGPALGGKTTNLETLHKITDPEGKTTLTSLKTSEDRTLFFDLLPFDLGEIQGYNIRVQVYTVPGQVHYNTTRKIVLTGADSIIFVADSEMSRLDDNRVSFENMKANLLSNRMNINEIPIIIQCNKIDLKEIADEKTIVEKIGFDGYKGVIKASAIRGDGVIETFQNAVSESLVYFAKKFKLEQKGATEAKLRESLTGFFGQFKERVIKTDVEKENLQATIPVHGLSEEEQLSAALKSTTEIAEQYNEVDRLKRLYQNKVEEMEFLYALIQNLNELNSPDEIITTSLQKISQFKKNYSYSLFEVEEKKPTKLKGVFNTDSDPLIKFGNTLSGNIALDLIQKRESFRLDGLREKITELTGKSVDIPDSVLTLCFGDTRESYYSVFVYAKESQYLTQEEENFFHLYEGLVSPLILSKKYLIEISKANENLERKVVERTAELSKALEGLKEVDKVKRAFLDNISHEIKTPLSNIKSYSDFLVRHPEEMLEKGKGFLATIKRESDKLEKLFNSILSFSSVKEPIKGEETNLTDVLNLTVARLVPQIKKKNLYVEIKADSDKIIYPINKEDASILMEQLIDNAIKYSPVSEKIKVFILNEKERVIFSVRDYGEGFPKDDKQIIIEPKLAESKEVASFKEKGLGLGLFLVREIVSKYNGTINIDNMEPGTNILVEFTKN